MQGNFQPLNLASPGPTQTALPPKNPYASGQDWQNQVKHQSEEFAREQMANRLRARQRQNQYAEELNRAVEQKKMAREVERQQTSIDRAMIDKITDASNQRAQALKNDQAQQRRAYGAAAREAMSIIQERSGAASPQPMQRETEQRQGTPAQLSQQAADRSVVQSPYGLQSLKINYGATEQKQPPPQRSASTLQPVNDYSDFSFLNMKKELPRRVGLKAESNTANGGVGVSYSSVVLAGPQNPREKPQPLTSLYKASFDERERQKPRSKLYNPANPPVYNSRYVHVSSSQPALPRYDGGAGSLAFIKGVDFNSKQKYDYNILSNEPLAGALRQAGAQSLMR